MLIRKPHRITIIAGLSILTLMLVLYLVMVNSLQQWLCDKGAEMLSKEFGTTVRIDSVSISVPGREVVLYGFAMEDRRNVTMIAVDTLGAKVELLPLLHSRLVVNNVNMLGLMAVFYKQRRDTTANYQFVFDVIKSKQHKKRNAGEDAGRSKWSVEVQSAVLDRMKLRWDVFSEPLKTGDTLDGNHLCLDNVCLHLDSILKEQKNLTVKLTALKAEETKSGMALSLGSMKYQSQQQRTVTILLERMKCSYRNRLFGFARLGILQQGVRFSLLKPMKLRADSLTYYYNNGKPHKRTGKPHRGYFDAGHMNAVVNAEATMLYLAKDSIRGEITRMSLHDKASGLSVKNVTALLAKVKDSITVTKMHISLKRTGIYINKVSACLLKNGAGKTVDLGVRPFPLTAKVYLCDISRPFAPVLSDFTTPLDLRVTTGGTMERLNFNDINISTPDKRLRLTAYGDMCDVLKRFDLRLHFYNIRLDARKGIKETIISHFSKKVRMKMVRQITKIGDIRYRGRMGVFFKREDFSGTLFTNYGNADFAFTINGRKKEMTGRISTDSMALGHVMNVKGLGTIKADATYCFNVASRQRRPPEMRGRLPIGWLKAHVDSAKFKGINFTNVSAVMDSNGKTAMGEVFMPKKMFDISLRFWYTQTDSVQNVKFKPRLLKHKNNFNPFADMKKWKDYMKEARKKARGKAERAALQARDSITMM